ncbi:Amino Acid-Polyamine-Organocation (APC) Family [Histomonas meleagridis]|uniref:Amino Acid-Polyamine-Organocation (APC) Family n=1 Tax=Histomonas meleagridis TaxID=135588 RepID=UPI0035596EE6|nr:Amino Acid-Polyamine-Organocation (APC) Family [Histomonas meleagridis]KAH0804978.1 Amino Acid-Polyamine-Organocation (APC) Family [Histomonas meleagridis]
MRRSSRIQSSRTKANSPQPLTLEEKRKLLRETRVSDSVIEQQLLNIDQDIGTISVETSQKQKNTDMLIDEIQNDLAQSEEVVSKITSYHFSTQHEYEQKLNSLKDRIAGLESQLRDAEAELANLKSEKKRVMAEKDSIIENQKREMKEMAYQFSDMLMKTLITITEDFETQIDLDQDEISSLPHKERLKEFNLDRIRI